MNLLSRFTELILISVMVTIVPIEPGLGQEGVHRFVAHQEDGVPTAVTTGGPLFEGELFRYEHILTMHQNPEVEESLISSARGFAMTRDGFYVVVDNKLSRSGIEEARLVVFDSDGKYIRSMGQVGSGPGDFQSMLLAVVEDETISVFDSRLRRLTNYGVDGSLDDLITAPQNFHHSFRLLFRADAGPFVAVNVQDLNIENAFIECWFIDNDGNELGHIRSPSVKNSIMVDQGGQAFPYQFPYPPIPAIAYLPERGVAISPGSEPVLEMYNLEGVLEHRIRVEGLPLEITREDLERFDSFWVERLEGIPEAAQPDMRKQRNTIRNAMPDSRPPWTNIAVDDHGFWWLRKQEDPDVWITGDRTYSYHILSPEGEYLGMTVTPPTFLKNIALHNTFPISVSDGHFLTMESDPDTGENLLNVYRMVPIPPGFQYRQD